MTARAYRTADATWRAECRDDKCRSTNSQRTYWRTGHLDQYRAEGEALVHNTIHHRRPKETP